MSLKAYPDRGIHQLLGQVRVRIRQAQRRTTELKDVQTVLENSHRSAAQLVQKRALRIIKKVKARRNDLIRDLYKKKVEQYSLLEAEINDTEMYTENMVGTCEQTESLLAMRVRGVRADLEIQLKSTLSQSPSASQVSEISIPTFLPDRMADIRLGEIITNGTSVSSSSLRPVMLANHGFDSMGTSNDTGHCSDYDSDGAGSFVVLHGHDDIPNAGEPQPIRIRSFVHDNTINTDSNTRDSLDITSLDDVDCSLSYEEFKEHRKNMVSSDRDSTGFGPKDVRSETNLTNGWGNNKTNGYSESTLSSSLSSPCIFHDKSSKGNLSVEKLSTQTRPRKWSAVAANMGLVLKSAMDLNSDQGYDTSSRKTWSVDTYEYLEEPRPVFSIQKWGTDAGQLNNPYDVAFLRNGNLAVAESNRLQIFDMTGRSIRIIGEGSIKPRNVVVTPYGNIGITDKKDHCIKIFTPQGQLVKSWGKDMFTGPTGVALYGADKFIVTDVGKNAVTIHMHDGRTVREFRSRGIAANSIKSPTYLTSDPDANIYMANHFDHYIYMYNPMGELIRRMGGKGSAEGKIRNPRGITIDLKGNIIVSDSHNDRLSVFDREGLFVRNLLLKKDSIKDPGGVSVSSQDGYLAFTENGWKDKLKVYQIYKT